MALGFLGLDFVGGGVAGAGKGAPHVPTGDGAIGAPAFAEGEEFLGAGLVLFAVGDGPAFLYAEVVDGENVGATEAKDQKHFDGPGADAADRNEAFDEFFVRQLFGRFHGRDNAFDGFFREVFHSENFCAGEAGFAKRLRAELEHFLRRGNAASLAEGFDAAEDGGGGLAGNGLVGDGFEEGFVGGLVGFHVGLEGGGGADKFGDGFVARAEMLYGGVEIEGKSGRLADHGRIVDCQGSRIARNGRERKKNEKERTEAILTRLRVIAWANNGVGRCEQCRRAKTKLAGTQLLY